MPQFTNTDKTLHGKNARDTLEEIFSECKKFKYIKEVLKDYRCGYEEYDNRQFYCNFVIVFKDDTKWIVNITTSFRSDRLKGNQWDTYNIKEIDPSINYSILVYPDDLSKDLKDDFIAYKMRILNHQHFSAIDNIVGQGELFELIENYANGNLKIGARKDIEGNNFESLVAKILSSRLNFVKWTENKPTDVGFQFDVFERIVDCFGLDRSDVAGIRATCDKKEIGRLTSGGTAKTDIIVSAELKNGEILNFTISCKKTSAETVAVGEFKADDIADILDPCNGRLRELLLNFQAAGSFDRFGGENSLALEKEIKPYIGRLFDFLIYGTGGKEREWN